MVDRYRELPSVDGGAVRYAKTISVPLQYLFPMRNEIRFILTLERVASGARPLRHNLGIAARASV